MVSDAQSGQRYQYQGQNTDRSGDTEKPHSKDDWKQKEVQGRNHPPVSPPPLKPDTKHVPQTGVPTPPQPAPRQGHASVLPDNSKPPQPHGNELLVLGLVFLFTLLFYGVAYGLAYWRRSKWIKRRRSKRKLTAWWAVAAVSLVLSYFVREWPFYLVTEIAWVALGLTAGWCWIDYDRRKINGSAGPLDPDGDVDQLGFFNSRVAMRSLPLFEITIADIPLKGEKNSQSDDKHAGQENDSDEAKVKAAKDVVAKAQAAAREAAAAENAEEMKAAATKTQAAADAAAKEADHAKKEEAKAQAAADAAAVEAKEAREAAAKPEAGKELAAKERAAGKERTAKAEAAKAHKAKDAALKAEAEAKAAAVQAKAANEAAEKASTEAPKETAKAAKDAKEAAAIEAAKKVANTAQGQRGIAQRLVRKYWGVELKITKCVATPDSVTVYFSEPVSSAVDAKIRRRYQLEREKPKDKSKPDGGAQEHKLDRKKPEDGGAATNEHKAE